ncbi:MAG: hypothetical protein GVY13_07385 [Alphaproteobacteria bacterium]|nr:hypothetical protein [Alphaproteobacteria bacterium]
MIGVWVVEGMRTGLKVVVSDGLPELLVPGHLSVQLAARLPDAIAEKRIARGLPAPAGFMLVLYAEVSDS